MEANYRVIAQILVLSVNETDLMTSLHVKLF